MDTKTNQGYLFLADISGYTSFLAKTELDHAHEILTELLEVIVKSCNSILTLSKLEGDAVFSYVFSDKVERGETLLELVEATYAAFRDRATSMHRTTTCTCAACQGISNLDLKFIVHYGDFIIQNIASIKELVGSDVNLAHRLMKNHVAEGKGWHAYALFTARALQSMAMQLEDAYPQVENYEHLGADARQLMVSEQEAEMVFAVEFPAEPPIVWEWLNDPVKKNAYQTHNIFSGGLRPRGRTLAGAQNHCAHGKTNILEIIAAWRPFKFFTSEYPLAKSMKLLTTHRLEAIESGTRVTIAAKIYMPFAPRFVRRYVLKKVVGEWEADTIDMARYGAFHARAACNVNARACTRRCVVVFDPQIECSPSPEFLRRMMQQSAPLIRTKC